MELEDVRRVFLDEVPRYTEEIMGAIGTDGSVDRAAYDPVLIEMGAAGRTGFVLMAWARLLAWAYTPDEQPFGHVAGKVDQKIIDRATELVSVAGQGDDGLLLDRMARTSRELQSDGVWDLIWCMAWPTKQLLDAVGGYRRFVKVIDLITPGTVQIGRQGIEQVALALAALSRGQHDFGRSCLANLVASMSTQHLLAAQLQIGAAIMSLSTARVISLDDHGMPEWVGPLDSQDATVDSRLMNMAVAAIAAVQDDDAERAGACADQLRALPDGERMRLTWVLAVSLGYSVARHFDERDDW